MTTANGFTSTNTESVLGWSGDGKVMKPNYKNFYSIYYYNCYNTKYASFEATENTNVPITHSSTCTTKGVVSS